MGRLPGIHADAVDEVRNLIERGRTTAELAEDYAVSASAVLRFVARHGLPKPSLPARPPRVHGREVTPDEARRLQVWIEDEMQTQQCVADRLGWSRRQVGSVCRSLGIQTASTGPRRGDRHFGWRGGVRIDKDGYVNVYCPEHPHARRNRTVLHHRLVMEEHLGRYLHPLEVVHHRNGQRDDNRIENLELFDRNSDHLRHELTGQVPRWSEDGKCRIREAVKARHRRRRESRARANQKASTAGDGQ